MSRRWIPFGLGRLIGAFGAGVFVLAIIGLVIGLIILIPILFIWSLNVLFKFNIEYTVMTWLAALIFLWFLSSIGSRVVKK